MSRGRRRPGCQARPPRLALPPARQPSIRRREPHCWYHEHAGASAAARRCSRTAPSGLSTIRDVLCQAGVRLARGSMRARFPRLAGLRRPATRCLFRNKAGLATEWQRAFGGRATGRSRQPAEAAGLDGFHRSDLGGKTRGGARCAASASGETRCASFGPRAPVRRPRESARRGGVQPKR
jgi:hypothetical protein